MGDKRDRSSSLELTTQRHVPSAEAPARTTGATAEGQGYGGVGMGSIEWRRVVGNGSLLGTVLAGHLGLLAVVLAYRGRAVEWQTVDGAPDPAAIVVSLSTPLPPPPVRAPVNIPPPMRARPERHRPPAHHAQLSHEAIPPAGTPAVNDVETHMPPAAVDAPGSAVAYGDPYLRRALSGEAATHDPTLPGYSDGSRSKSITLAQPETIRGSLKRIGDFMSCSKVKMKRQLAGNDLDRRLGDAYGAMGCKI